MRYAVAVLAGIVLSGLAAGTLGSLGPSAGFPPLAGRSPWRAYRALAGAPFGSAMELFVLTAVICTACLFAAGLLQRRRDRAAQPPAEVPEPEREEVPQPW